MNSQGGMQPQAGHNDAAPREIIDGLSAALNREVTTFLRYMVQGAIIKGAQWENVRDMYLKEVGGELAHAQYLANKLAAMGVTPQISPNLPEPPQDPEAMLRHDIEQEYIDVENYKRLADLADRAGLIELKMQMENQAADEQGHAELMTRLLG